MNPLLDTDHGLVAGLVTGLVFGEVAPDGQRGEGGDGRLADGPRQKARWPVFLEGDPA